MVLQSWGPPDGNRHKIKVLSSLLLVISKKKMRRKFQGCPEGGARWWCQQLLAPPFGRKRCCEGPENGVVPDGPLVILSKGPSFWHPPWLDPMSLNNFLHLFLGSRASETKGCFNTPKQYIILHVWCPGRICWSSGYPVLLFSQG